jgi:hypothetical protein
MGRQAGPGSGQRFAADSPVRVAIASIPFPTSLPTGLGVLRFRLAALLAAQLFDFGTFTVMVTRHGIVSETNPIVAHGFVAFGLPLVAVAKGALVLLVGSILVILGRRAWAAAPATRRVATSVALVAVASGLLGGISNAIVH